MLRPTLAIALLLLASAATAQVYKWTDTHGTVHYSETPPTQGTKYQRITPTGGEQAVAPPTVRESEAAKSMPAATAASEPMADTPANRAKLCASLKSNLDVLNGSGAVVLQQGDKPQVLDDTQRRQQIAAAEDQYKQFCSQ